MDKCEINHFTLIRGSVSDNTVLPDINGEICLIVPLPSEWYIRNTAVLTVKTESEYQPEVSFGLVQPGSFEPVLQMKYRILQNCQVQVPFPITENALRMESFFLPPRPGVFKGNIHGRAVEAKEVDRVEIRISGKGLIYTDWPSLEFVEYWEPSDISGSPLIDAFGQRIRGTWEGKTESFEELSQYLYEELEKAGKEGHYPPDWSKWGGWKEKRFSATGWFRCENDGRRWWLVDPDGYAFFSNGMCYGNRTGIYSMADHLDSLFSDVPEKTGLMAQAWTSGDHIPQYVVRNGLEDAMTRQLVNFARVNMIRVFGDKWLDAWIKINAARMHAMGINTIGIGVNDYDDEFTDDFLKKAKIPYVITLKKFPLTTPCIFRDFPDVFSEEYALLAEELAEKQLGPYRDDPYMIGYFVTNEPEWLFYQDVNLCEQLMNNSGCIASKKALKDFLMERYNTIEELNTSWNMEIDSFDVLLERVEVKEMSPAMKADCEDFHRILVSRYCSTVCECLKKVDPNHLNLGMRYYALTENKAEKVLGGILNRFDAFSFNRYGAEPASSAKILAEFTDMPCIIGEWHIGAADSGLDQWGLYYADSQRERAQAISYYLEQSTAEKNIIGVHYFEYSDQPYLGRFDGECYNIGIIDVCNRPYPLVMKAYKEFAAKMYPMLTGDIQPETKPVRIRHIGE